MSTTNPTPAAYCRMCGRGLTESDVREVRGAIYCESCIATRLEGDKFDRAATKIGDAVNGAAKVADGATRAIVDGPPSIGLATFLGFIPGAGAMYNGQFLKAFAHIMIFFTLVGAADHISDFFGLFVAMFMAYMVIDAHKTAKARLFGAPLPDLLGLNNFFGKDISNTVEASGAPKVENTASDGSDYAAGDKRAPIGAIVLIVMGCLFLLCNFVDFNFHFFQYLWPIAVIMAGVYFAFRRMEFQAKVYLGQLMGPAIVITVGVVWLLSEMRVGRFWHEWWPLFLIVIGGVKLFSSTVIKDTPSEAPASDGSGNQ